MAAAAPDASVVFERKEYNVVDFCRQCCCCFTASRRLILEPEEAVLEDKNICCTSTKRAPYGEMGTVDKSNCLCCVGMTTGLTGSGEGAQPISPGCGCSEALVNEILEELKKRIKARGDTGQIQRTEKTQQLLQVTVGQVTELNAKVDLILRQMNIQPPPAMQTMEQKP
mmetsp:Transcript_18698/g.45064  ORF Transcript_18698/g.45064 Transcript_18698/m.45064 type:complete len:169 (-) Transcript_18698:188-694(-)